MLLFADISVSEVGYQIGIESPAQFSRLFESLAGLIPTAYRNEYLHQVEHSQTDLHVGPNSWMGNKGVPTIGDRTRADLAARHDSRYNDLGSRNEP